ncbi:Proteasome subunit alpha type-3 [Camellia lanceoleosa]|uniref:Proteasome subunit alpha type-3 n=1 Tax=Camellia lanceoleosa TaxID=1840588 RepID=A0ACC0IW16_9ERIC|nr:Proteasome subunit alpha type-3 [Camellia lanceoleosa]
MEQHITISWIDKIGFIIASVVAGLAADGRQVVARARSEATNYERPFGCGVILGGYDRWATRYFGAAIGKEKQAAKRFTQGDYYY